MLEVLEFIQDLWDQIKLEFMRGFNWGFRWEICFFISLFLVAVLPFLFYNSKLAVRYNIKFFHSMIVMVAAASMVMFYPVNRTAFGTGFENFRQTIFHSILNTVQIFSARWDLDIINKKIPEYIDGWIGFGYKYLVYMIYIVAPGVTLGFSLSFFQNLSSDFRCRITKQKNVYVFSELNEKSLALAKDYKNQNEKSKKQYKLVIVFTNVEDMDSPLVHEARELHAICSARDITVIPFKITWFVKMRDFFRKNFSEAKCPEVNTSEKESEKTTASERKEKKVNSEERAEKKKSQKEKTQKNYLKFFLIGKNEDKNLIQAITLIEKYKFRKKTEIYVFSKKIESGLVLSSMDTGKIDRVKRIHEIRLLINSILIDYGDALFDTAREDSNGVKNISALIIGMGHHGTEMLKALAWYCQMDGYSIEINAFEKDRSAKSKFAASAPRMMRRECRCPLNPYLRDGSASKGTTAPNYKIHIHTGIDTDKKDFICKIMKIPAITYVFVALGNDTDNIRTAVNLRTYFTQMGIHPIIHAVVYDSQIKKALEGNLEPSIKSKKKKDPVYGLKTPDDQSYDIRFVGDRESIFTKSRVEPKELEERALRIHEKYDPEEEFLRYEYSYNASISSAIHQEMVKKYILSDKNPPERDMAQLDACLDALEHRRRVAYLEGEGYTYNRTKNHLAKTHHALKEYDQLDDSQKKRIFSPGDIQNE